MTMEMEAASHLLPTELPQKTDSPTTHELILQDSTS